MQYLLNDTIEFDTKQALLEFIRSDTEFLQLVESGLKHPLAKNWYPSDGDIILRITCKADDGLNVFTELKKFDHTINSPKLPIYNWHRTYESIRHSGANYSDETPDQKKAYFDLDDIQNAVSKRIEQLGVAVN